MMSAQMAKDIAIQQGLSMRRGFALLRNASSEMPCVARNMGVCMNGRFVK